MIDHSRSVYDIRKPSQYPGWDFWFMFVVAIVIVLCVFSSCSAEEINVYAIMEIESNGNPHAYNFKSGARGLMQIMPCVLSEYNYEMEKEFYKDNGFVGKYYHEITEEDLYKPNINIEIGTWYINERIPEMLKFYKIKDTTENRLIAYNFGIGNLIKYLQGKKPLPKETRNYIIKYNKLRAK